MPRYVVLFAREPARQAREKGLPLREAAVLFTRLAAGWSDAARRAGARFVVATPPADRAAWRRALGDGADLLWISQRGRSFGERLAHTARQAAAWEGTAVIVGGDVAPSLGSLAAAFEALENGADAALAPAPDGGVSLLGLKPSSEDLDLVRKIAPRRRNVFAELARVLGGRGRRVAVLAETPDVDGRCALRVLRRLASLAPDLARVVSAVLEASPAPGSGARSDAFIPDLIASPSLRGPPLPA